MRKHITLSRRGTGETRQHWWKGLSVPPLRPPPLPDSLSSLPDDNWDWNTFSSWSLIQWVNCNMGKTWMGPKLCGDSATEPLRVTLCGRLQKGNVLLISIIIQVSVLRILPWGGKWKILIQRNTVYVFSNSECNIRHLRQLSCNICLHALSFGLFACFTLRLIASFCIRKKTPQRMGSNWIN